MLKGHLREKGLLNIRILFISRYYALTNYHVKVSRNILRTICGTENNFRTNRRKNDIMFTKTYKNGKRYGLESKDRP